MIWEQHCERSLQGEDHWLQVKNGTITQYIALMLDIHRNV
jgi:hypothetical protein